MRGRGCRVPRVLAVAGRWPRGRSPGARGRWWARATRLRVAGAAVFGAGSASARVRSRWVRCGPGGGDNAPADNGMASPLWSSPHTSVRPRIPRCRSPAATSKSRLARGDESWRDPRMFRPLVSRGRRFPLARTLPKGQSTWTRSNFGWRFSRKAASPSLKSGRRTLASMRRFVSAIASPRGSIMWR